MKKIYAEIGVAAGIGASLAGGFESAHALSIQQSTHSPFQDTEYVTIVNPKSTSANTFRPFTPNTVNLIYNGLRATTHRPDSSGSEPVTQYFKDISPASGPINIGYKYETSVTIDATNDQICNAMAIKNGQEKDLENARDLSEMVGEQEDAQGIIPPIDEMNVELFNVHCPPDVAPSATVLKDSLPSNTNPPTITVFNANAARTQIIQQTLSLKYNVVPTMYKDHLNPFVTGYPDAKVAENIGILLQNATVSVPQTISKPQTYTLSYLSNNPNGIKEIRVGSYHVQARKDTELDHIPFSHLSNVPDQGFQVLVDRKKGGLKQIGKMLYGKGVEAVLGTSGKIAKIIGLSNSGVIVEIAQKSPVG